MIRAIVVGQEEVMAHLQEVEPRVYGLVRQAVRAETLNVLRAAKLKVSGLVLKTRTGTLRRKINAQFEESGASITGSVGLALAYGAIHEYGGTVTVREHTRRMTKAWGRAVKKPRQITVRSHKATYPERSYLRSSLKENETRIKYAIAAAVAKGLGGSW